MFAFSGEMPRVHDLDVVPLLDVDGVVEALTRHLQGGSNLIEQLGKRKVSSRCTPHICASKAR